MQWRSLTWTLKPHATEQYLENIHCHISDMFYVIYDTVIMFLMVTNAN